MTGRSSLGRFLSGFLAAVAPFAAMVGAATLASSPQGTSISPAEWIGAVVAAVVAAAAIDARQFGPVIHAGDVRPDVASTSSTDHRQA